MISFSIILCYLYSCSIRCVLFLKGTLSASIKENSPVGFIIATILASDADKDPIFYYIKGIWNSRLS